MLLVVASSVVVVVMTGVALVRGGRLRIVLPIAVSVLAFSAALTWFNLAEPTGWDESTVVDDRSVRVFYTGSECEGRHSASVTESDQKVTINVTTREWATSCSDVGFRRSIVVRLNADLGARRLIDGNCRGSLNKCERTAKPR